MKTDGSKNCDAAVSADVPHATLASGAGVGSGLRRVTGAVVLLVIVGAALQVMMSVYSLTVAHSPAPRDVPVGFVTEMPAGQVESLLENGGQLEAHSFTDAQSMIAAIERKDIYGGVDLTAPQGHLYVASAAGPAAAAALRTAFTVVADEQKQQQLAQLTAGGGSLQAREVEALVSAPEVTDIMPLPRADSAGASIGLLVQAIALGASVASLGLGRIGPKTTPSSRRAAMHLLALFVYAAVSAVVVLIAGKAFGVVPEGAGHRLYWAFTLLSLAISGSVSGLVALIGPAGAALGTAYFLFGVPIAGAAVLPEFLPPLAGVIGQALPTGAGVTLVRDSLYFPGANLAGPLVVLVIYAVVGALLVLVSNAVGNRSGHRNLLSALRTRRSGFSAITKPADPSADAGHSDNHTSATTRNTQRR